ncbi:hypothetical protein GGS24DRAFT_471291 [Hypoxylon argillaceum]|nr:hypothetical protein GGS24DRAFT_471291 [Hypoxylon argillaceum]
MTDQDMRLRLVVRRNGLPELRLMWHVQLSSNPTISKLLEQLNDHIPLEGEHWGLEDYVVELQDSDGTSFECLHYHLVRSVLKPDDRVFIRALERDDRRRRRISGRFQISSDGRHLIDGVPFGRPPLRTPTGRPITHIPPRKRARLTFTQQDDEDSDQHPGTEGSSLALTLANQELHEADDSEDEDHDVDYMDPVGDDGDDDDDELSNSSNESRIDDETDDESEKSAGEGDNEEEVEGLDQEAHDLAVENAVLDGLNQPRVQTITLDTLDKLTALQTTFPMAPIDLCEKVLAASKDDLKTTYKVLSEGFPPQLSQEAILAWKPGHGNLGTDLEQSRALANSASTHGVASERPTKKRKLEDQPPAEDSDDDVEDESGLVRKYDHAGFPPGTITSGTGLTHMAAISASFSTSKINGNSEATTTTLKAHTEEPIEEDDDTSSSGSSSDSTTSSDESEDTADEGVSSSESPSLSSSDSSDDSDPDSDDEFSVEPRGRTDNNDVPSSPTSEGDGDSDSDNNDSGPEEYPFEKTSRNNLTATDKSPNESDESSDDTSDNESTGTDSSSESEEDSDDEFYDAEVPVSNAITTTQPLSQARPPSPKLTQVKAVPIPVPPGEGKDSTRRRNARRRKAKLTKKDMRGPGDHSISPSMAEDIPTGGEHAPTDEAALFQAKRKALLEAIATGGIEVRPSGETTLDDSFVEKDGMKRKRTEENNSTPQHDKHDATIETIDKLPDDDPEGSPASQKRRRIDLGSSRRLVFGALGLRNPKNKEEEDKLRNKLQSDAQLRANHHPSSQPEPPAEEDKNGDNEQDPNDWKLKINYRAVECSHDNIELSAAPFPFQQRWDPQQQNFSASKKNKRGGQSKRAQRNQAQYYNDGSRLERKRKHHDSSNLVDNGYDDTGDGNEAATQADITLNYDDIDSQDRGNDNEPENVTSQATDLDDLPSLPKDVSVLPILRPGQAEVGMVITWQKWSCSSATSWQPQLSRVTAIVVMVDDNAVVLRVCLAKRDRHLDGNEKRYDYRTGQRIYDKFEAPDLDEDDEADDDHDNTGIDEGFREVPWADMQDPRILQQPLDPTIEFDSTSKCISSMEIDETTTGIESESIPTEPPVSGQHGPDTMASPTRLISLEPVQPTSEGNSIDPIPRSDPSPEIGGSWVESSEVASNSTSHQTGQSQQSTNSAMSDISQISSPSRQLYETTSQAIGSNSPAYNWARTIEQTESPRPNTSDSSMPLPAAISSQIITGTPKAVVCPVVPPSSASSLHSGRQPDYTMDGESHVLDTFEATDELDHPDYDDGPQSSQPIHRSPTPRPTCRTVTPDQINGIGQNKATGLSPITSPTSKSLPSSPSSIWCTAVTSHSTQSPWGAHTSSIISKPSTSRFTRDEKYEEAMRKLDEEFDNLSDAESPLPPTNSLKVKRESSSQFPSRVLNAISPPPRRKPPKPFIIPAGSQVVELSSDSESVYEENYADDDIDENYSPIPDSMPRGDGWVQKQHRKTRRSII